MPRIQGGRPGPGDVTFTVAIPSTMTPGEIAAVGDALGPYVWFDDHIEGGLLCWYTPSEVEATEPGGVNAWWAALCSTIAGLGAAVDG